MQPHAEHVGVTCHGGADPVEHAEPALGSPEGRRAGANLIREDARARVSHHNGFRLKLPPIGCDRARPAELDLREDAPDVAACGVIGSEQTRIAAADGLRENHHVPHILLEHRTVAQKVAEITGCC